MTYMYVLFSFYKCLSNVFKMFLLYIYIYLFSLFSSDRSGMSIFYDNYVHLLPLLLKMSSIQKMWR